MNMGYDRAYDYSEPFGVLCHGYICSVLDLSGGGGG